MIQHPRMASLCREKLLLTLAAALLCLSPLTAAAPPPKIPEVPGPGPLFDFHEKPDFQADPLRMSLSVFAASTTRLGPYSGLAALYAGEHKRVQAWKLEGPMTNKYSRLQFGVAAAFLAGFQGNPAGLAAINEVVTLRLGHQWMCWALLDTDRFRPLPKDWMSQITDGRGIGKGGLNAEMYSKVLIRANYTSTAAFAKAVRKDLTYAHLNSDPAVYRGEVVRIEGKLKRINKFPVPREAAEEGVNDLYEAWVFSEMLGTNPYCVIFTEWPAELPRDLLGERTFKGDYKVRLDGYFFMKFRYKANQGRELDAPLLIGHGLVVLAHDKGNPEKYDRWMTWLSTGIVALFGSLLVTVVGLTWWFRRSDTRIRQRLLTRSPEFALPPPDATPVAPPVAPPVKRMQQQDRTPPPRLSFPTGSGHRGGEKPIEGEKRGTGDKPPEEGAGA